MFKLRVCSYENEYVAVIAYLAKRGIEFTQGYVKYSTDKCIEAMLTAEELRNLKEVLELEKPFTVRLP